MQEKSLTVSKTAELCGVGRSTIGYWIRSNKLNANRIGKKYFIPVDALIHFLESSGYSVPKSVFALAGDGLSYQRFPQCWKYWDGLSHGERCQHCLVFKNTVGVCFTAKCSEGLQCPKQCCDCEYYLKFYFPRVHFISQIALPAMIYKGLVIWGGNSRMEKLIGIQKGDLVGLGVENIVHQESLRTVIQHSKKRALMDSKADILNTVFLKTKNRKRRGIKLSLFPLSDPRDSFLAVAEADTANKEKSAL